MKILKEQDTVLLNRKCGKDQSERYFTLPFSLPFDAAQIKIEILTHSLDYAQLPVALFSDGGKARLLKASDGEKGDHLYTYLLGERENTPGSIPGTVAKGDYTLIIYKRRMAEDIRAEITVSAAASSLFVPGRETTFQSRVVKKAPGWYRGELHVHSAESTGRVDIRTLLDFCKAHNIDFICITDHFTASHWQVIEDTVSSDSPLCLKSMEISGDRGHMNAHGLTEWINPLVDDNEALPFEPKPTMSSIAEAVHEMGGFVSINHPLSGLVSWHYDEFDIKMADALEIWCTADYQTTFLYPTFWDGFLRQGIRLTGIGSSDSHHPTAIEGWKMGQVFTVVKADELSQEAIIRGIKKGCCYVAWGECGLEFKAEANGKIHDMGDTIKGEGQVRFSVTLLDHPSGHLIIMKDGFQQDAIYFDEGERDEYGFTLDAFRYCRVEFHEDLVKTRFWGMVYRDHKSMRLLSNPIWHE